MNKQEQQIEYNLEEIHNSIEEVKQGLVTEVPNEAKYYQIGKQLTLVKQKAVKIQEALYELRRKRNQETRRKTQREKQKKDTNLEKVIERGIEEGMKLGENLKKQGDTQPKQDHEDTSRENDQEKWKKLLEEINLMKDIQEE